MPTIKEVIVVKDHMYDCEEIVFTADTMPMAKHFADVWAKRNGYKLVKSPAKIAELFPTHLVSSHKNQVIFYAIF